MKNDYNIQAVQQELHRVQNETADKEAPRKIPYGFPLNALPKIDTPPIMLACVNRAAAHIRRAGQGQFTRDESIAAAQQFMLTSFKIEWNNVTQPDKPQNKDADRTRLFRAAAKEIGLTKPQIALTNRIMRQREHRGMV